MISAAGQTTGTISVGATTAPSGSVSVSAAGGYADADVTLGAISVAGGTSVTVDVSTGITDALVAAAIIDTSNNTIETGDVSVTGIAGTTAVSVSQPATVAAVDATLESTSLVFGAVAMAAADTLTIGG